MALCEALLSLEGYLCIPEMPQTAHLTTAQIWELKARANQAIVPLQDPETRRRIGGALTNLLCVLTQDVPAAAGQGRETVGFVPLHALVADVPQAIEGVLA